MFCKSWLVVSYRVIGVFSNHFIFLVFMTLSRAYKEVTETTSRHLHTSAAELAN
jgi:hypothetical protein